MISRALLEAGGVLSLVTVLICTTTTRTTAEPLTNLDATDDTTYDSTPSVTNDNPVVSIAPSDTNSVLSEDNGILEQFDVYNSTGSEFTEQETTISDINVNNTEETNQLTFTASVSTFNGVYNTTVRLESTSTSVSDVPTNQVPQFNTTLAIRSAEEEDSLKKEAETLRIVVIVLSIIAGLSIICTIILVLWLILVKRKQKKLQTASLMEISKQQKKFQDQKWLQMTKMSSSDDIDSGSSVSRQETGPNRADTPARSSEIDAMSYSNMGVKPSNPADAVYNNIKGTYVNYNQTNEYVNQRSQNNAYGNRRPESHVSESPQNDEIYNNIDDGMNPNQAPSRRQDLNPGTRASSGDEDIYMNSRTVSNCR